MDLIELSKKINIAEDLPGNDLNTIGERVWNDYDIDKRSRADWEEMMEEAMKLARQIKTGRTWAGETVSDIRYPIIASASIQFGARALPSIVKDRDVVKCRVIGSDEDSRKAKRASNVSQHMNFQIMDEMECWEDDTDQLLASLPIYGTYFKKIYYKEGNRSELISPEDLVVNYYAKNLETASRITHEFELYPNEIVERINEGFYRDIDIHDIDVEEGKDSEDEDAPQLFLEQHRWLDLDGDGYKEPYIVTIKKSSHEVARIAARFNVGGIKFAEDGSIIKIKPVQYFVQYTFLPAFDGSFYRMGFGVLLSPLNSAINTLFNQLIDAGTLSIRQCGFLSRGIRLSKGAGSIKFKQGEWKYIQMTGDDIRKGVLPLPLKEPSLVLFQLLGMAVQAAKELASNTEVLSGEQSQHNVPATTTLALIEQGLKVFSAIYKRVHRSLKKEFGMLRNLNMKYLKDEDYQRVLDEPEGASALDYNNRDLDIIPLSDSADVTDVQRLMKAEALKEYLGSGVVDDNAVVMHNLEAMQIPDVEKYLPKEEKKDPKVELENRKLALDERKQQFEEQRYQADFMMKSAEAYEKIMKIRSEVFQKCADAINKIADAESKEMGPQIEEYKSHVSQLDEIVRQQDELIGRVYGSQLGRIRGMEGAPGNNTGA